VITPAGSAFWIYLAAYYSVGGIAGLVASWTSSSQANRSAGCTSR
jgi:hypothetical protein